MPKHWNAERVFSFAFSEMARFQEDLDRGTAGGGPAVDLFSVIMEFEGGVRPIGTTAETVYLSRRVIVGSSQTQPSYQILTGILEIRLDNETEAAGQNARCHSTGGVSLYSLPEGNTK